MAEPTTSFADSGEAAISQKIEGLPDISAPNLSTDELIEYYDVERTVDEIVKGGYGSVRSDLFRSPRQCLIGVVSGCASVPR